MIESLLVLLFPIYITAHFGSWGLFDLHLCMFV